MFADHHNIYWYLLYDPNYV